MKHLEKNEEIEALNRVLHLLEENSFGYLASQRTGFRKELEDIYSNVESKITKLQRAS